MARGFESKSVEAQQEEAARGKAATVEVSPEEQRLRERRRTVELARTRAQLDLSRATAPAHKQLLEQAIAALDRQLDDLARLPE
jgi:hypothetical protein